MNFGFEHWLFTFCFYCMIGWLQESAIESLYHKKPINRGFLKGPYIPIYGVGGIILLLVTTPFRDNAFVVFFVAMAFCTVLEYFTGWLMETMFNKQFWDYSMFKLVYKNRISLVSSLFWGVMGLFMAYVVSYVTYFVIDHLPYQFICVTAIIVPLIMTVDFFIAAKKQIDTKRLGKTFSLSNIGSRINVISRIRARYNDYRDSREKEEYKDKDETGED